MKTADQLKSIAKEIIESGIELEYYSDYLSDFGFSGNMISSKEKKQLEKFLFNQ